MSTPLETTVRTALLANAGLTALIGQRLYMVQLPQNPTYPAGVMQRISTVPFTTLTQGSTFQSMGWCRFSFTFWANGANGGSTTDQIAQALQAAMLTFNASLAGSTAAPNRLLTRSLTVEPNADGPLAKARIDYSILYQEIQ